MNLDIYTEEMAKSIWDKAFFMDKIIGTKCVIDFGCADGAMIRMLAPLFPSITFIGYDSNSELIERGSNANTRDNVIFWYKSHYWQMINYIRNHWNKDEITINFSSVLHEVFSNTEEDGVYAVKILIEELQPKYITIRDMYFHMNATDPSDMRPSELQKVDIVCHYSAVAPGCYNPYVNKFGYIKDMKDLVHFMMKSQWYGNDYEQELKENYFSWNIEDFKKIANKYRIIFETHYLLPYYLEQWKEYGIGPNVHTHAQFILRRDE